MQMSVTPLILQLAMRIILKKAAVFDIFCNFMVTFQRLKLPVRRERGSLICKMFLLTNDKKRTVHAKYGYLSLFQYL